MENDVIWTHLVATEMICTATSISRGDAARSEMGARIPLETLREQRSIARKSCRRRLDEGLGERGSWFENPVTAFTIADDDKFPANLFCVCEYRQIQHHSKMLTGVWAIGRT